ncbi:MAG TPA: hypothetical protein H9895_08195 [Candidatus Pseudogracilibacillus intestinigallinarum]|uniref:CNNM transmembrane domain-containing protein n=1 Tax=Candidatus Pseudogracilibacillus intestinigallinarum TaxID=2838742 RepID=A0A9D1TKA6_9BACI|nr:hypothetical protein [Candidatus Pseudogracilibacillus intestinigallinarum]
MNEKIKSSIKFSLTIAVITFVLAAIFSSFSSTILPKVSWMLGMILVLFFVVIGIFFDMLGIAAAAADQRPLHAMAAEKVTGAREAVLIYKNADKFASFCNDVIGDISGIISGSALAIVIIEIGNLMNESPESPMQLTLSIVLTSLIAALTVGGKALGKYFAMNASTSILLMTGKAIYFIQEKMKINIFSSTKNNQDKNKKKGRNK